MDSAEFWVEWLKLEPLPEGGWFREIYRAPEQIAAPALPPRYQGSRALGTSIYFLLKGGEFSALHRLKSDEIWHFYLGSSLTIHHLWPDGRYSKLFLGPDARAGQLWQAVIPAGAWFGASLDDEMFYALIGCTLSPGYDARDFELAGREDLLALFPDHRDIILRLTRP